MLRKTLIIFIFALFLFFNNPAYSYNLSSKSIDKYINNISNKFSKTYCNTIKFGISKEGALAFAIGETNKEFKNNTLNKFIDYSLLKDKVKFNLETKCKIYDFPVNKLVELVLN